MRSARSSSAFYLPSRPRCWRSRPRACSSENSAGPELERTVHEAVLGNSEIISVNELRTLHLGPSDVLLTMSVDFADDVPSQRIEALVSRFEHRIRERFPIVRRVYIEVQSQSGHKRLADGEWSAKDEKEEVAAG